MPLCTTNETRKREGEKMAQIECKEFLSELKRLEISMISSDIDRLPKKLQDELLGTIRKYMDQLEEMEPGTMVEVI